MSRTSAVTKQKRPAELYSIWKLRVKYSIYVLGLAAGLVLVEWILKYAVAGPIISVREVYAYTKSKERPIIEFFFPRSVYNYVEVG